MKRRPYHRLHADFVAAVRARYHADLPTIDSCRDLRRAPWRHFGQIFAGTGPCNAVARSGNVVRGASPAGSRERDRVCRSDPGRGRSGGTEVTPATWFWDLGIPVFPTANKVPVVPKGTSQFDYRCSRAQAARFKEYGVPLGLFVVIDSDSADTEAWVASHVPDTTFKVTTGPYHDGSAGRGRHRYFRVAVPDVPSFIYRDGHTIECKHRGHTSSAPAHSARMAWSTQPMTRSWNPDDVPFFPVTDFDWDNRPRDAHGSLPGQPYEFPPVVHANGRHRQLFLLLRSCKAKGWERDETLDLVLLANENRCSPPLSVKDKRGKLDAKFETWFNRAWKHRDRPFETPPPPLRGLRDVGELL